MAIVITRPISEEQRLAGEQKRAAVVDAERKTDQDLLNAYLLEKIAQLEAETNEKIAQLEAETK